LPLISLKIDQTVSHRAIETSAFIITHARHIKCSMEQLLLDKNLATVLWRLHWHLSTYVQQSVAAGWTVVDTN